MKQYFTALKALCGAVALFLAASTVAFAQGGDGRTGNGKKVAEYMQQQLSLNTGQSNQVNAIIKDYMADQDKIDANLSPVEKSKKVKAANDKWEKKLKSVLTDVQYKKYAANRSAYMEKLKEALKK